MSPLEPLFVQILQISIVVDNIDIFIKRYEECGIGPWKILSFDSSNCKDMMVRGKPASFGMKAALCDMYAVQLEMIEPTDDRSVYWEFLKKHGPGLHHIACAAGKSYEETVAVMKNRGNDILTSGSRIGGKSFGYIDALNDLGIIIELYH
jgi:hypothetical protein